MDKTARLARLQLSDDEKNMYMRDLEKILSYVDLLNQVNTDGVEPIVHGIPQETRMREDEPRALEDKHTKEIVSCSSDAIYEQYRVPQVIGGET